MKKHLLGLASLFALAGAAQAQTELHVSDIQSVPQDRLANCDDAPQHLTETVKIKVVALTPGGQAITTTSGNRQIFVRDVAGPGPFQTINVFPLSSNPTTPSDLLGVFPGDTLELIGVPTEYQGTATNPGDDETEFVPATDGVTIIGSGPVPQPVLLDSVGVLNDHARVNRLTTGEQYEGEFVELRNLRVVAVSPFSNNARVSFTVSDPAGALIEVSDRFLAGRLPNTNPTASLPSGRFRAPVVGDNFTSIKGIIIHNRNGCPGTGSANRGYTINPFDSTHYQRGASAPSITAITISPLVPCSRTATTVTASISDDGTITSPVLHYGIGETGAEQTVTMTAAATAGQYEGVIPGQPDGTLIRYYVTATDDQGNISTQPNVPSASPSLIVSRCGGPTIRDIQFTPFTDGNAAFRGLTIDSLRGVVTSSSTDLGQIFIQTPGATEWSGIWLRGNSALGTLTRGQEVVVSGKVDEAFNVTNIIVDNVTVVGPGAAVAPVELAPEVLSNYDFTTNEKYEGMLTRVSLPNNASLYVVDSNVGPDRSNFGEYRVGASTADPNSGAVIQAGNQSTTNFSSLNVSYVNNTSRWSMVTNPTLVSNGDRFESITGIVYYGFSTLLLLPRDNADVVGFLSVIEPEMSANATTAYKYTIAPNPVPYGSYTYITSNDKGTPPTTPPGGGTGGGCNCPPWRGVYLTLYDGKGSTVPVTGTVINDSMRLDVTKLPTGVYNLNFYEPATGYTESQRMIIK